MDLLLASGNAHKAEEFSKLCSEEKINVCAASEKIEVVEDGSTFYENSLKKAQAYYDKYKKPILADDSGLIVGYLPDELGIRTARFGGENLSDEERARLLVSRCEKAEGDSRSAYFVCILCCYLSPDEIFYFEGRLDGSVAQEYKGEFGFGYDPVFIPTSGEPGKTLAMQEEFKMKYSHRSKALESLLSFFRERDCQ